MRQKLNVNRGRSRAGWAGSLRSGVARLVASLAVGATVGASVVGAGAAVLPASQAFAGAGVEAVQHADLDRLIMRNGKVIEGHILRETTTQIQIEVIFAGISAVQTYDKADILSVDRAPESADAGGKEAKDDKADSDSSAISPREKEAPTGGPVVYHMTLTGVLGREIHKTPVHDMLEDAKAAEPDYLIVELDNAWESWFGEEKFDVEGEFDQFFQAEDVIRLFTRVIPMEWPKQPRIVFWVKNAMGGVAFFPFLADDIYFHPDGKMGGVGNLSELMEGTGDAVVREKQRSLRLAMAEGVAIRRHYPYQLVRAMARREYVLSYTFEGGTPKFLYREPEGPTEISLTVDGTKNENKDSMRQIVTGETREVLTLRADDAQKLGVAKGLASTFDDVLDGLGILRNYTLAPSRADRIAEQWDEAVSRAKRDIPKMLREYEEVGNDPGRTRNAGQRVISRRIRILEDIKALLERYEGAIYPQEVGVQGIAQLNLQIEQLRIQLILMNP